MVTALRQMSALMLFVALGGCAVPSCPPEHKPLAPLRDLVGRPVDLPAGRYRVMPDAVPEGQFPCSVAVARLRRAGRAMSADTQPSERNGFVLDPFGHKESVCWAELFDNIASVSEVFPVDSPYLPSQPAEPGQVVRALSRVHAGLCVILSEGDVTVGESVGSEGDDPPSGETAMARQVVGVIYETRHENLLAIAKSELFAYSNGGQNGADRSVAEELAAARFRQLVHEAMCELVESSRPGAVERPNPWSSWPSGPGPLLWPGKR
ncbi:MAG TPA: hypothetical protein VMZ31_18255 [Phycisphaerae bacterium]|nr:hypothetical protein [Phycisphaerae bacterium]